MNKKGCSGACDQGRKDCITPFACELEETIERNAYEKAVEHIVATIMIFLIACCSYVIWSILK
jgi:hypothetical protein